MSETTDKTIKRKELLKKYAVFTIMGLICAGSIWLIFSPSEADKQKEKEGTGFNTSIPDPKKDEIISDKQDAYEKENMDRKKDQRMKALGEVNMLGENEKAANNLLLADEQTTTNTNTVKSSRGSVSKGNSTTGNSVAAYQDINRTLGNFYETPKDDPEKKELKKKLDELEAKMQEREDKQSAMNDQLALMEKSYQLAAKYMPQGQNGENPYGNSSGGLSAEEMKNKITKTSQNGKTKITPVKQVREQTVSALSQPISHGEFFEMYDQPRNMGFNTMGGETGISTKNTIAAIVDNDQMVVDGQSVRLRLTEPLIAGSTFIPENTIITGMAKIQGERLDIQVTSIEYEGTILSVEMAIYDSDGQKGIFIPGSLEMNAVKEIAANMGNSVGTSFTVTQNAGQQIASDVTKGVIQGASQYMAKKIRQVKVTLKAGYKVMLMPKSN